MIKLTKEQIQEASDILSNGGVLAFPTETVYGLGIVFDNENTYEMLIKIKNRPMNKPFSLMCSSIEQIEEYATISAKAKLFMNSLMPGEITVILKAKPTLPDWAKGNDGTVGVRIPNDDFVISLIKKVGKPLLVPSANKSGEKPATSYKEVCDIFANEIDAVVEGECISAIPSTVIGLCDNIKLYRKGSIPFEKVKKLWEGLK